MDILTHYVKAINEIDDYLEYAYRCATPEEIKESIMNTIDHLTARLLISAGREHE